MLEKKKKKIKQKPYYVYILECVDDSLYTGITLDINKRLQQHLAGTASHYTRAHKAKKIVYSEKQENKSKALKREAAIKRLSRLSKKELIIKNR